MRASLTVTLVLLSFALLSHAASVSAADADPELAFNNHCRECHSAVKDDNRLGPSLYGVVGRKAGSLASFHGYSPSLQDSTITWTPDMLDKWITDPNAVASGNNMAPPFPGVADPAERKQIIVYLKSDTNPTPAKRGQTAPQTPAPTATR